MTEHELSVAATSALTDWLDQHAPQLGDGPLRLGAISGGSTNLIMSVDRGAEVAVLRGPPLNGASPQGAKTIAREATVLAALGDTDVPCPAFHVYCESPDVIGVPFYLMERVDGWAATITEQNTTIYPQRFDSGPDQYYLAYAMADGLIAMANLDWQAAGLQGFGKPDGYLDRQVDRWLGQLDTYPVRYPSYEPRQLDGLDYVADWLRANLPDRWSPGLMHGDYANNNVLFENDPPSRLKAIIDWETATIGDPMVDIAAFVQNLPVPDEPAGDRRRGYFDTDNVPPRADMLAYLESQTGRDVSHIDYYFVLARFRTACMIEYKVAESIQGLSPKAKGDRFDALVRSLLSEARDLAVALG